MLRCSLSLFTLFATVQQYLCIHFIFILFDCWLVPLLAGSMLIKDILINIVYNIKHNKSVTSFARHLPWVSVYGNLSIWTKVWSFLKMKNGTLRIVDLKNKHRLAWLVIRRKQNKSLWDLNSTQNMCTVGHRLYQLFLRTFQAEVTLCHSANVGRLIKLCQEGGRRSSRSCVYVKDKIT